MVVASTTTPHVEPEHEMYYAVDPQNNCEPILDKSERPEDFKETEFDQQNWERVTLTLFSMLVSVSILAGFDPTTFYTAVVIVVGVQLRPVFIYGTWRGFIYESTSTDAVVKLLESVYMKRHEEDLIGEEENYRMV